MAEVVEKAVAVLRKELGLAPLPEPTGARHAFETEHCEVAIVSAPSGRQAVMVGRLGWLSGDARQSGDDLRQVLKLGLALTPLNRAAVGLLPELGELGVDTMDDRRERLLDRVLGKSDGSASPVAVGAYAFCGSQGTETPSALEDICQWANLTAGFLAKSPASSVAASPTPTLEAVPDMMIIRP